MLIDFVYMWLTVNHMLITVNEQHFRNCESLLFYSQFSYEKHLRNELFECVILKTLQKHFFWWDIYCDSWLFHMVFAYIGVTPVTLSYVMNKKLDLCVTLYFFLIIRSFIPFLTL